MTQITQQAVIGPGASIIDGIKAQVAVMAARTDFKVRPTAIYINPLTVDLIDREAKAQHIDLGTVAVAAGIEVKSINTVVGPLPLISEPWLARLRPARLCSASRLPRLASARIGLSS